MLHHERPHRDGGSILDEDALRARIATDIMDSSDSVRGASKTLYSHLVAELKRGTWEDCFLEGVVEGLMIAADIVGPLDPA